MWATGCYRRPAQCTNANLTRKTFAAITTMTGIHHTSRGYIVVSLAIKSKSTWFRIVNAVFTLLWSIHQQFEDLVAAIEQRTILSSIYQYANEYSAEKWKLNWSDLCWKIFIEKPFASVQMVCNFGNDLNEEFPSFPNCIFFDNRISYF